MQLQRSSLKGINWVMLFYHFYFSPCQLVTIENYYRCLRGSWSSISAELDKNEKVSIAKLSRSEPCHPKNPDEPYTGRWKPTFLTWDINFPVHYFLRENYFSSFFFVWKDIFYSYIKQKGNGISNHEKIFPIDVNGGRYSAAFFPDSLILLIFTGCNGRTVVLKLYPFPSFHDFNFLKKCCFLFYEKEKYLQFKCYVSLPTCFSNFTRKDSNPETLNTM